MKHKKAQRSPRELPLSGASHWLSIELFISLPTHNISYALGISKYNLIKANYVSGKKIFYTYDINDKISVKGRVKCRNMQMSSLLRHMYTAIFGE